MAVNILLLKDVGKLGRRGDVVSVKSGFARNYLLPQGIAEVADKFTLRKQQRLQEERKVRADKDKKESEELSKRLKDVVVTQSVKVDPEGHMYGSVTVSDLIERLQEEQKIALEKKNFSLPHPIKKTGVHTISLNLKEEVVATFILKVTPERGEVQEEVASLEETLEAE